MTTHKTQVKQALRHYRKQVIQRWKQMKGCASCGVKLPHYCLDIDHVDPMDKPKRKANLITYLSSLSWINIKKELSKCQILCANCHRMKTHEQKEYLVKRHSGDRG